NDGIDLAVYAHAAADTAGGGQFGVFRAVGIAPLDVEAVEPQQHGRFAADIGRNVDGHTLVHVILDVAVPQLVPDDEGQGFGGESGSLRLWYDGALLPACLATVYQTCATWVACGPVARGGASADHAGRPGRHIVERQGHRHAAVMAHQGDHVGDADMIQRLDRTVVKAPRHPTRVG